MVGRVVRVANNNKNLVEFSIYSVIDSHVMDRDEILRRRRELYRLRRAEETPQEREVRLARRRERE